MSMSLSSGRDVCRSRAGSSRCDFVGVEPRAGILTPSPAGSRRASAVINSPIQHLIDEWTERQSPHLDLEHLQPHILPSGSKEPANYLELGGPGEKKFMSVVLPWMHITVHAGCDISLEALKQGIFQRIKKMAHPLYSTCAEDYVFRVVTISPTTELPELTDLFFEEQLVSKVTMASWYPMLFLYEPEGFRTEKDIAKGIDHALGYPLHQLESQLGEELRDCRVRLFGEVEEAVTNRKGGFQHYAFPEDLVLLEDEECSSALSGKIASANLRYQLFYRTLEDEKNTVDINAVEVEVDFEPQLTPSTLISAALKKIAEKGQENENTKEESADDFLLQLVGRKCFIPANERLLINYTSVRSALEDYRMPQFVLRRKDVLLLEYPESKPLHKPAYVRAGVAAAGLSDDKHAISLWTLDEMLTLRPVSCSNMGSSAADSSIYVQFGVFCGNTELMSKRSGSVPIHNPRWQEDFISLDLYMKDLPPASILSISLVEEKKNRKASGASEERVLGWVNVRLFDWKGELLQGMQTLSLWSDDRKGCGLLNPGRVGQAEGRGASRMMMEIANWQARVRLPAAEKWEEFVDKQTYWGAIELRPEVNTITPKDPRLEQLQIILRNHLNGDPISKEDEKLIWECRHFVCEHVPDALVIIAECNAIWQSREHFAEIYVLLKEWKPISIGAALLMLGKNILDGRLRQFAVEQLEKSLDKQTFHLFILPLVQALKCEPYACSALALLLIRKALSDYQIGHKLFWILRAELADMKTDMDRNGRFSEEFMLLSLLIEAYLRGNEEHIRTVTRQVGMVERLTQLSVILKSYAKDVASKKLREELRRNASHFENVDSPLDPTNALGELLIEKCKVLGSAKMPLRLCWRNKNPLSDHYIPHYEIIFKNGDDLRQDMLVLQVLEVMDSIWKKNDLDCCLSPYPVLPMGTKIGMIGVVSNCSTIFEIQSEGGKVGTAVKSLETTFINKYIRNHATATKDYLACVDRFRLSCVGYSVATFIMGIKDRHNDNIMMTEDGKLFHIDFGHILGHGKTKLGIQRDRVPFVLTEHFLCVIAKGKSVQKSSHDVNKFKQQCVEAYLMLWEVRSLFVSLFTVMQGMQLPELSTQSDLEYLKRAFCVEFSDREEADKHFSAVFDDAFNGSWSTKTNWFFHTVKHL